MFWLKLKAGALQLTLFVAVVIALLLTAFILLVDTHKRFKVQTNFIIETAKNCDKGIRYALSNRVALNDTIAIDSNDEDYKTLRVYREFWGVFEKITTVSKIKNNNFKKIALMGGVQPQSNRVALYAQDNDRPLVLVGKTKIEGVAYLPKQGLKSGTISGHSFYGSQLINGEMRISNKLPELFSATNIQLSSLKNYVSQVPQEQFLDLEHNNTYKNSFLKPVQVVFSNETIQLNAVKLSGNILVQSQTKIVVEASSVLKDIVLIAPEIEINNNVIGNFQAIASKELKVGNNVILEYPSALVLSEKKVEDSNNLVPSQNRIIIDNGSVVKGIVLFLGVPKTNNYDVQVELKENSKIIGEVYCNQNLELKGMVYGTVYTNNFIAKAFGSIYQNHIYNGTIIINELSEKYVGLPFNNSKKGVVKWLY